MCAWLAGGLAGRLAAQTLFLSQQRRAHNKASQALAGGLAPIVCAWLAACLRDELAMLAADHIGWSDSRIVTWTEHHPVRVTA